MEARDERFDHPAAADRAGGSRRGHEPPTSARGRRLRSLHARGQRPACAPAHTHELAARACPHGPRRWRRSALLLELRPSSARLAEALPDSGPSRPEPLPDGLRRRRGQRRDPSLPVGLPRQDRDAAADAGGQARARGDRPFDHLVGARRRGRLPAALDLRDGNQLIGLPCPTDRRGSLRRRRLRASWWPADTWQRCHSSPDGRASRG